MSHTTWAFKISTAFTVSNCSGSDPHGQGRLSQTRSPLSCLASLKLLCSMNNCSLASWLAFYFQSNTHLEIDPQRGLSHSDHACCPSPASPHKPFDDCVSWSARANEWRGEPCPSLRCMLVFPILGHRRSPSPWSHGAIEP
jgi:hypothetical protein